MYCSLQSQLSQHSNRLKLTNAFFYDGSNVPNTVTILTRMDVSYARNAANCSTDNAKIATNLNAASATTQTWLWTHRWSSSLAGSLLNTGNILVTLTTSNGISYLVILLNYDGDLSGGCSDGCVELHTQLHLNCTPTEDSLRSVWEYVLQSVRLVYVFAAL